MPEFDSIESREQLLDREHGKGLYGVLPHKYIESYLKIAADFDGINENLLVKDIRLNLHKKDLEAIARNLEEVTIPQMTNTDKELTGKDYKRIGYLRTVITKFEDEIEERE